jgi:nucleoside-diphosphate-sugar epimerase
MLRVAVTGAGGFIGRSLQLAIASTELSVRGLSRNEHRGCGSVYANSPFLGPKADWTHALKDIDAVVHCAGTAQAIGGNLSAEVEAEYFRVNTEGTRALARQSVTAGVRHFIFLSSAHAVTPESDSRLTERSDAQPKSVYGRSKLSAEIAIREELANSGCAWTILRPPLVYGARNKANFDLLVRLVRSGVPMPFASIHNRRSFLYVENLVDVIAACLGNRKAFGRVYFPSDGTDVSTPDLIRAIAGALVSEKVGASRLARLFPFPELLLKQMAKLPGLGALRKLTASLCVDSEPLMRELEWSPRYTMLQGLKETFGSN